ncbi:hypothetical protein ACHAPM_011633 [Fusarium culmorum]
MIKEGEQEQDDEEPERRCTGPELAHWFEAESQVWSIEGGLGLKLRDSDTTLSSETAPVMSGDKPIYCVRGPATQIFGIDPNRRNSAPINPAGSDMKESEEMQSHTWLYVVPLRIAHQRCEPARDGGVACSGSNARRRLAMFHYQRQYYERLVKEAHA